MLEITTLRVVFGVIALTQLALLYLVLYRRTRAAFAGWWCVGLLLMLLSSVLYTAEGTSWQWLTNPVGNALAVAGCAAVWCSTCSLNDRRPPTWQVVVGPVAVLVVCAIDDPGSDPWAGGPVFLLGGAAYLSLCAHQMWRQHRAESELAHGETLYGTVVMSLAVTFALLAGYYLVRAVTLWVGGADGAAFQSWFGSASTTLLHTVMVVVAAFSVSVLSAEQRLGHLHTSATRDALTGMLNRAEFLRRAQEEIEHARTSGEPCVVVMADLDFFKTINDTFGHATGDRALRAFAQACRTALGADGLVGRLGGEEFGFLLVGADPGEAEQVTAAVSRAYQAFVPLPGRRPTVSYGVAPLEPGVELAALLERADAALYRAKAAGRGRTVHHRA